MEKRLNTSISSRMCVSLLWVGTIRKYFEDSYISLTLSRNSILELNCLDFSVTSQQLNLNCTKLL